MSDKLRAIYYDMFGKHIPTDLKVPEFTLDKIVDRGTGGTIPPEFIRDPMVEPTKEELKAMEDAIRDAYKNGNLEKTDGTPLISPQTEDKKVAENYADLLERQWIHTDDIDIQWKRNRNQTISPWVNGVKSKVPVWTGQSGRFNQPTVKGNLHFSKYVNDHGIEQILDAVQKAREKWSRVGHESIVSKCRAIVFDFCEQNLQSGATPLGIINALKQGLRPNLRMVMGYYMPSHDLLKLDPFVGWLHGGYQTILVHELSHRFHFRCNRNPHFTDFEDFSDPINYHIYAMYTALKAERSDLFVSEYASTLYYEFWAETSTFYLYGKLKNHPLKPWVEAVYREYTPA